MLAKYSIFLVVASILSMGRANMDQDEDDLYECSNDYDNTVKHFPSQMTIYNLNESFLGDLKKSYKLKIGCLFKFVDSSLTEMNHVYSEITSPNTDASIVSETTSSRISSKKSDKKKNKKIKISENFLGQFGILSYSINQNNTISLFKHESIKYMRPLNETNDVESTEADLFKYRNDINVLKKLLAYLKIQEKETLRKLKLDSKEKEKAERALARVAKEAEKLEKERHKEQTSEKIKLNDFKSEMKSQL